MVLLVLRGSRNNIKIRLEFRRTGSSASDHYNLQIMLSQTADYAITNWPCPLFDFTERLVSPNSLPTEKKKDKNRVQIYQNSPSKKVFCLHLLNVQWQMAETCDNSVNYKYDHEIIGLWKLAPLKS